MKEVSLVQQDIRQTMLIEEGSPGAEEDAIRSTVEEESAEKVLLPSSNRGCNL